MRPTPETLKEIMQGKTDDELFEILASNSWDYTREATEAALAEFKYRKLKTPTLADLSAIRARTGGVREVSADAPRVSVSEGVSKPAAIENVWIAEKWTRVKVPRHGYRFPNCCPACLGSGPFTPLRISSDEEKLKGLYLVVRRYEYLRVSVPFCSACAGKVLGRSRIGTALVIIGLIASVAISIWLDFTKLQGFLLVVALCGPAMWLQSYYGRSLRISGYDNDSVTFSLRKVEYARRFLQANDIDPNCLAGSEPEKN